MSIPGPALYSPQASAFGKLLGALEIVDLTLDDPELTRSDLYFLLHGLIGALQMRLEFRRQSDSGSFRRILAEKGKSK